jgi:HAD superfamily hydrolase (TIGR01509 family)
LISINSWKPEPDLFLLASREMVFSPSECIVIEDSQAGVIAAIKGGFPVFGFATRIIQKYWKTKEQ